MKGIDSAIAAKAVAVSERKSMETQDVTVNNSINIQIDHFGDYEDFITKLRDDPEYEKLVQEMTLGRLVSSNPMGKYAINWK